MSFSFRRMRRRGADRTVRRRPHGRLLSNYQDPKADHAVVRGRCGPRQSSFMRSLFYFFLCSGLGAAELRVDHVTVCGPDVKRMQAALTDVGIPSEYGGPHSNHATEMALTSFPDGSYLEQIAIQPNGDRKA